MTNRRGSTTARLVPAKTGEQLFERTQEHLRPLIGMIDELNEVGARLAEVAMSVSTTSQFKPPEPLSHPRRDPSVTD